MSGLPAPHLATLRKNPSKSFPRKIVTFLNFSPTFVIPDESEQFSAEWEVQRPRAYWMVTPPLHSCSSAGAGAGANYPIQFTLLMCVCGDPATVPANPNTFWSVLKNRKKNLNGFKLGLIPASTCGFPCSCLVVKTSFLQQPFTSALFVTKSLDFQPLVFLEITKGVVYLLNLCVCNTTLTPTPPSARGRVVALSATPSLLHPSSLATTTHITHKTLVSQQVDQTFLLRGDPVGDAAHAGIILSRFCMGP